MQRRSSTRQTGRITLCAGLGASLTLVLWLAGGHAGRSTQPGAAVGTGTEDIEPSTGLASAARVAKLALLKDVVHDGPAGIRYVGEPERFVSADGVTGNAYKLPAGYVPAEEVDEAAPLAEEMAEPPAEEMAATPVAGKVQLDGPELPDGTQPVDFAAHGYQSLLEMEDAYRKQLKLGNHINIRFYERTDTDGKPSLGFQIFPRSPENVEAPEWMPPPPAPGQSSGFVPPPLPEN